MTESLASNNSLLDVPLRQREAPSPAFAVGMAFVGAVFLLMVGLVTRNPDALQNPDSILRMVAVRDLLAGQSWFDVSQYRLGLDGGTPMHWSRLVDLPIALIVMLANVVGLHGETVAATIWPAMTAFGGLSAIALSAARIGNRDFVIASVVIGTASFFALAVFAPGFVDHHNMQIALAMWLVYGILPARRPARAGAIAGSACAAMLAIGMETLPHVAFAGTWIALAVLLGYLDTRQAKAFGLSLAASTFGLLLVLTGPVGFASVACDSFSRFHLVMSAIGGLGLFTALHVKTSALARIMVFCGVAALVGAAVVTLFPHCVANPLGALPPIVRERWLDGVVETASIIDTWHNDPFSLFTLFALPVFALTISIGWFVSDRDHRGVSGLLILLLATSIAVATWQQRGAMFAVAFSTVPLAWYVHRVSKSAPPLVAAFAWVPALHVSWIMTATLLTQVLSGGTTVDQQLHKASAGDLCQSGADYTALATEPPGVVFSATNYGPFIISHTPHRAVAGPYHRNIGGNLFYIETALAPLAEVQAALRQKGVTHVALCPAGDEEKEYVRDNPDGLIALLMGGMTPDWLEPLPDSDETGLMVWRLAGL